MSLAWMGAIAAIVALEKISKRGETIITALGGLLVAVGLLLLVSPSLLATLNRAPAPLCSRRPLPAGSSYPALASQAWPSHRGTERPQGGARSSPAAG